MDSVCEQRIHWRMYTDINKHMKIYPAILPISDMKIKTTLRHWNDWNNNNNE